MLVVAEFVVLVAKSISAYPLQQITFLLTVIYMHLITITYSSYVSIGYITRCRCLCDLHTEGRRPRGCVNREDTEPSDITDLYHSTRTVAMYVTKLDSFVFDYMIYYSSLNRSYITFAMSIVLKYTTKLTLRIVM